MNQRSREVVKIFKDELAKTVCAHYCRHIGSISLKRPIQLDFRLVQNVVRAIFVFGAFKSEQVEIYLISTVLPSHATICTLCHSRICTRWKMSLALLMYKNLTVFYIWFHSRSREKNGTVARWTVCAKWKSSFKPDVHEVEFSARAN